MMRDIPGGVVEYFRRSDPAFPNQAINFHCFRNLGMEQTSALSTGMLLEVVHVFF